MEERFSICLAKFMEFEQSGQRLKVTVDCENLKDGDVSKIKDFLERMFKEILDELSAF